MSIIMRILVILAVVLTTAVSRADRFYTADSTSKSCIIRIVDSVTGEPETGVTSATSGLDLEYVRMGASPMDISESDLGATNSAYSSGGMIHVGGGRYRVDIPDAALDPGVQSVDIQGTCTGMIVIPETIILTTFDLQTVTQSVNVSQISGDATAADNLESYTDGTTPQPVNVTQFGGAAGTFASGRPEVNTTHWAGTAVGSANVRANVLQWNSSAVATPSVAGVPEVDITHYTSRLLADAAGTNLIPVDIFGISGDTTSADNLELYTDGTTPMPVNVTQFGGAAGTFSGGRPEVNTTHWAGTAVGSVTLNANMTQISGDANAADQLELAYEDLFHVKWATDATTSGTALRNAITGGSFGRVVIPSRGNYNTGSTNLTFPDGVSVVGADLEGVIVDNSLASGNSFTPGVLTTIQGVTLRNTSTGNVVGKSSGAISNWVLRDSRVLGGTTGISFTSTGVIATTLDNVIIRPDTSGVVLSGAAHELRVDKVNVIALGSGATLGADFQDGSNVRGDHLHVSLPNAAGGIAMRVGDTSQVNLHQSTFHGLTASVNIQDATALVALMGSAYNRSLVTGNPNQLVDIPVTANMLYISGDATAADNLESYTDGTALQPVNTTQWGGTLTTSAFVRSNVLQWNSAVIATPSVAGVPEVDITHYTSRLLADAAGTDLIPVDVFGISGDAAAADALETYTDGTALIPSNIQEIEADTPQNWFNGNAFIGPTSFQLSAIGPSAIAPDAIGASELAADAGTEIGSAVRTNLTTELGRIDVATSTRLAAASYVAPLDAAGTRAAVGLAAADLDAQLAALPTGAETAAEVRTNLATELGRIDTTISSRLPTTSYTAPLTAAGTRAALGMATANLDLQIDDLATLSSVQQVQSTVNAIDVELDSIPTGAENAAAVLGASTAGWAANTVGEAVAWMKATMTASGVFSDTALEAAPAGGGGVSGGGLSFVGYVGTFNPEADATPVVQNEQKLITIAVQAKGTFADPTPGTITVKFKDEQGNVVTVANADITRVLQDPTFQIIRFTLPPASTAALEPGFASAQVSIDNETLHIPDAIRVIKAF